MSAAYSGGCACGAIRYEIAADPMMAGHCQCLDCQKATGTGHASMLMFPEAAMKMTGKAKYYETKADSGNTASRGFCTNCGSPVLGRSSGFPGMVTVMASSLDDPNKFQPGFIVYAMRARPWDRVDPALQHFPKMPPAGPS